jgi:phosphoribosyl-AMP cyclohydrolase
MARLKAGIARDIKFDERGLVPAIVQDAKSGRVLMFAYMNRQSIAYTVETGFAHFYSRSRGKLWKKGEESGHLQRVREIRLDCDGDVILLKVKQAGQGACHTGHATCFFRRLKRGRWIRVERKKFDPRRTYGKK